VTAPAAGARHLEVEDLTTTFATPRGPLHAVDGVSFCVYKGRTLGIVGESGSGKTVLARTIMNLLPRRGVLSTGRVRLAGEDILGRSAKEMRRVWGTQVAMVFQDPMTSLNPVVRIGRQITESLRFGLGLQGAAAKDQAIALLNEVGIPDAARRFRDYPGQMSGGMRQRVVIAISLAGKPSLLMADEPTTALDVTVQAQILDLLAEEQRERAMAMVLVTHDLGVVANRTDDIVVMYAGQVVEQASTRSLFANVRMPYTEALLKSIPRLDQASHTRMLALPGRPPDLVDLPTGCRFAPRCPYAQDRCVQEQPPLAELAPGHLVRCWFPVGTVAGEAALEHNRRSGALSEERDPSAVGTALS
jgi:oligopeptide/dipeptide ABC transporter ATP-binding protein